MLKIKNDTTAEFSFNYTPFNQIGQDLNVASNTNATFNWTNLKASTTYEWFVEVIDSDGMKNASQVWNFTTIS